jgi:hypothetical protein
MPSIKKSTDFAKSQSSENELLMLAGLRVITYIYALAVVFAKNLK